MYRSIHHPHVAEIQTVQVYSSSTCGSRTLHPSRQWKPILQLSLRQHARTNEGEVRIWSGPMPNRISCTCTAVQALFCAGYMRTSTKCALPDVMSTAQGSLCFRHVHFALCPRMAWTAWCSLLGIEPCANAPKSFPVFFDMVAKHSLASWMFSRALAHPLLTRSAVCK